MCCTPSIRTPWCRNCRPSNVVPAGGVKDPRGALDQLFVANEIDFRQYNAGRDYARAYHSADPGCAAIVTSCDQALDKRAVWMRPFILAVVAHHKEPAPGRDCELLREALSYLAMHLDQVDIGFNERAAGSAEPSSKGSR